MINILPRVSSHTWTRVLVITGFLLTATAVGISIPTLGRGLPLLLTASILIGIVLLYSPTLGLYAVLISELLFVGGEDSVTPTKVAVFGLIVVVLARTILTIRNDKRILRGEEAWLKPLAMFLALCLLSILPGLYYGVSVASWIRELFPLLNYGLALSAFILIRSRKQLGLLLGTMILLAAFTLCRDLVFYLELAFRVPLVPYSFRDMLSLFNSTPLWWILGTFIPFAYLARTHSPLRRLGLFILLLVSLSVLFFSGTRTYWLGLICGLVIWYITRPRGQDGISLKLLLVLALGGGTFVFWFPTPDLGTLTVGGTALSTRLAVLDPNIAATDWSLQGRFAEESAGLEEGMSSPVVGHGLGYELTSNVRPWTKEEVTRGFLHNTYVYLFLKTGVVGLGVFIWFLGSIVFRLWQLRGRSTDRVLKSMPSILVSTLGILTVISLTASKLNDTPSTLILSILLGAVFGAMSSDKSIAGLDRSAKRWGTWSSL